MPISQQNERLRVLLQDAGLRATRPRTALAHLLFDRHDKHMTAEQVHAALTRRGTQISLATVYNALHQFTDAGLLTKVLIDPSRVYFDTNIEPHHHFVDLSTGAVTDIPHKAIRIASLPEPPHGHEVDSVDITIRLRRRKKPKQPKPSQRTG